MSVQHGSKPGPCKGKKFLVTGGSRGLGRAIVEELYVQGATVYALARNKESLRKLEQDLPGVKTISADLTDWDGLRKTLEGLEVMDGLINNAGAVESAGPFWEITGDKLDHMCNLDLKASVNISQVIAKKMIERGKGGNIVNMLAVDVKRVVPALLGGTCLKAALEMLTKGMALELAPHQIRVNAVAPAAVYAGMVKDGLTSTDEAVRKGTEEMVKMMADRTPTGAPYMPVEDVVSAVLFFASGVTAQITGECLTVDGGLKLSF